MRIVSDDNKFTLKVNNLEFVVAPDNMPPFNVMAVVEEQDVALLLGEDKQIYPVSDKPVWYLSNKLEGQTLQAPGDVILRHANPLRLLAIVHDFDQDPSWQSEWVAHALINIYHTAEENKISSLRLPVLGSQYGRFGLLEFFPLFVLAFLKQPTACLKRIWLVVEASQCEKAFACLKQNIEMVNVQDID